MITTRVVSGGAGVAAAMALAARRRALCRVEVHPVVPGTTGQQH